MGARTNYPAPTCPNCGISGTSRVDRTYYTDKDEIVRSRVCLCDHQWYTYQPCEHSLDPDLVKVLMPPKWGKAKSSEKRTVTLALKKKP